ncbi:MAG: SMC family ATPase, partial [Chloroflexi bacterium]|nr:SMC family ATPase [Chloroflexota bacterium]
MIPLELFVRNFLSYGDPATVLDFRGKFLLCLSGENGHGKSALLDAMTWALFGKARAQRDDDLLHYGAGEFEVHFDWEMSGIEYRVVRRRTPHGHTRTPSLELYIRRRHEEWTPHSGNSLTETERSIERILGMSYQTFINSAFLLQGRADEFTVKS